MPVKALSMRVVHCISTPSVKSNFIMEHMLNLLTILAGIIHVCDVVLSYVKIILM